MSARKPANPGMWLDGDRERVHLIFILDSYLSNINVWPVSLLPVGTV